MSVTLIAYPLNDSDVEVPYILDTMGEIDVATGHRITFFTSPTTIVYELILDDATYGVMDSTNVLG